MIDIYKLCRFANLYPDRILEVGVGPANKSSVKGFIGESNSIVMVEPHPRHIQEIKKAYGGDVVLLEGAVSDSEEEFVRIHDRGEGSFLDGCRSPHIVNSGGDGDELYFDAQNIPPEEIESELEEGGQYEIVCMDCEGAEWHFLKEMTSRPWMIQIEMYLAFHKYSNPYKREIEAWMEENGYELAIIDVSDYLWIHGMQWSIDGPR